MEYLFSYGTFQNPMVQEKLFHRQIKMRSAVLTNHALFTCKDGFFSIAYKEGSSINGSILELSENELIIADLWEIAPDLYQRSVADFTIDGQTINAWIYERHEEDQIPVEQSSLNKCCLSDEDLEKELNLFCEEFHSKLKNCYDNQHNF